MRKFFAGTLRRPRYRSCPLVCLILTVLWGRSIALGQLTVGGNPSRDASPQDPVDILLFVGPCDCPFDGLHSIAGGSAEYYILELDKTKHPFYKRVFRPRLSKGKATRISVYCDPTYTVALQGQDVRYGTTPGTPQAFELKAASAYWSFVPGGDSYTISVTLSQPQSGPPSAPAKQLPAVSFADTLGVDFAWLSSLSVSFSAGVLASSLHDDSFHVVATPGGSSQTGTVTAGLSSQWNPKGAALIHFSIDKSGDWLWGPCFGAVVGPNSAPGLFLGWSGIHGATDRFALSLGFEFSTVNRLSGYTPNESGVPLNATLTQAVVGHSGLELVLTYAFSLGGSGSQGGGGSGGGGGGAAGGGPHH